MRRKGFTLARKLACITTGIGLCMTLAFCLISYSQMREATHRNFQAVLTAVTHLLQDKLMQQYESYREVVDMMHIDGRVPDEQRLEKLRQEFMNNFTTDMRGIKILMLDKQGQVQSPAALKQHPLLHFFVPSALQEAAASGRPLHIEVDGQHYTCTVFIFEPRQWYVLSFFAHTLLDAALWERSRNIAVTGLAITLLGLVVSLLLGRRLTAPLSALDKAARELPLVDVRSNAALAALPALPLGRSDEVGTLARSFDFMVRQLHDNVLQLLRVGEEQARLQVELNTARDIQDGMLPKVFPRRGNLDVHGLVIPAREVGGDFFDAFMLDDNYFCFVVGDVSDKGVPAALVMSMALTLCRALPHENHVVDPAAVLERINDMLSRDNPRDMFVTMVFGVLHCDTGELVWANAGHMPPLLLTKSGHVESLPTRREIVVGAFEGVVYSRFVHTLEPGEGILLYTDGLTEAVGEQGGRWGEANFLASLAWQGTQDAQALNAMIIQKVQMFVGTAPQADDMTLLNFFWQGASLGKSVQ